MGRVRCVKPKGNAVSTTKTIRKKVVKTKVSGLRRSAKHGIGGRTRILPQQFDNCCGTGVCWGLYSLGCPWTDHILAGTPLLEVEADLFKISKGGDFPTDFHS